MPSDKYVLRKRLEEQGMGSVKASVEAGRLVKQERALNEKIIEGGGKPIKTKDLTGETRKNLEQLDKTARKQHGMKTDFGQLGERPGEQPGN